MPQTQYTLGKNVDALHDLTLPSGATCQAKRVGPQGLIAAGLLDNFDELTALVQDTHIGPNTGKGIASAAKVTPEDVAATVKLMKDGKEKIHSAFMLVDKLTVYIVTAPKVWLDYQLKDEPDDEWNLRQEAAQKSEAVPVRAIDLEDKMFLLHWTMGGSSDLAEFRKGSQALMANVDAIQAV